MVAEFNRWFEENNAWLTDSGVRLELRQEREAVTAYLETESYVASITVWELGSLDVHAVSCKTDQDVLAERYDLKNTEEMLSVLREFCRKLINNLLE